ncbi:Gaa1-domain-containing protein [Cryphonectria parasitica EP155]|uniref:Gaa1-domain-containing protein n=1 Tax=Cryphonectria parasitica (strain ATCC 38755 / EP155) TaxID=660469 RepID=A0A9P4XZ83_CRYP1|nr:Gaa1-domain-containing protein [Cryphonectria parasitica EP155]KAF3763619.1 Gaa1-domain-containing protein [Cryphonectria parasitica EP155]
MPTISIPSQFSAVRARSYVYRLPLLTRLFILAIIATWFVGFVAGARWDVKAWGALVPEEVGITSLYRTNTYPFIHLGFIHMATNVLALTPLLERFESEYGTLTALALFLGPFSTFPAALYILVENYILHSNTAVMGASVWFFLLIGMEAIRTYKTNPHFVIATYHIPTWTTPLLLAVVLSALVPSTSLLGHICGLCIGYICGLGYMKFLAPPEKALRFIEAKLKLLQRLPRYVSVDQKTYGRFGVLPSTNSPGVPGVALGVGTGALRLRGDPRLLKLPPYVSLLCIVVGVAWLLMLPQNDYSRRTYISENALLPGQVHTYFGGSDQNVFRAYKHEVDALASPIHDGPDGQEEGVPGKKNNYEINDGLEEMFKGNGLKVGRQNFTYSVSGEKYAGENVYAILHAPRGDATEAIVLVAAWQNVRGELNKHGVALLLTLARYFRRWSLWSKDIILLVTPDSLAGPQAWVDAYHDAHDTRHIDSLPVKSGALQGAIALDYAQETRFSSVHIVYDGINGQLPNLDLINSVVSIAAGQMGIGVSIQEMWGHSDSYEDRLRTMLRGMMKQGLGVASGPHSCFIPYHVDAVTLRPYGDGWQDEMAMGRVVEGTFRSLNNLLEHLHQSFFFYLLMHRDRFVSIGTYLPSAMLIAANFTIISISLWVKSGQQDDQAVGKKGEKQESKSEVKAAVEKGPADARMTPATERNVSLPLALVAGCQFLGVVPFYVFNHVPAGMHTPLFAVFTVLNVFLPHIISHLLTTNFHPTLQQYSLMQCFSLLLLGMFLSSLATLNFSLSLMVGLLSSPLSFMRPWPKLPALRWLCTVLLNLVAPTAVFAGWSIYWHGGLASSSVGELLQEAAFGWRVWGMYTSVVVWGVWWPAWLVGAVVVLGRPGAKGVGTR